MRSWKKFSCLSFVIHVSPLPRKPSSPFWSLVTSFKKVFPLPYIVLRFSGLNFYKLQNSNSKYLITVNPNQFGWAVNNAAVFVFYIYILIFQPSLDVFKLILHEKVLFWSSDSSYSREALRLIFYSCRYPGYQTNLLVCVDMLRHIFDRKKKKTKNNWNFAWVHYIKTLWPALVWFVRGDRFSLETWTRLSSWSSSSLALTAATSYMIITLSYHSAYG